MMATSYCAGNRISKTWRITSDWGQFNVLLFPWSPATLAYSRLATVSWVSIVDKSLIAEYIQAGVRILSAMEFVIRPFFDVNCMVNLQELWYHNSCSLLLCLVKFMLPAEVKALSAILIECCNCFYFFTFVTRLNAPQMERKMMTWMQVDKAACPAIRKSLSWPTYSVEAYQ